MDIEVMGVIRSADTTNSTTTTTATDYPYSWLQNLGIALEVLCPALALIVVSLRLWVRASTRKVGWDDVCIIVAMVLSIALSIGSIVLIKIDYIGIHYWDIPKDLDFEKIFIWTYVVGAIYNPILAIVKQSILIFILRFSGVKDNVRLLVWIVTVLNGLEMIAVLLVVFFECTPVEHYWKPEIEGTCIDEAAFGVSTAIITIVTDLMVLALPFYIFLGLNMKRNRKIALMGVFALGAVTSAVSIVRLYFMWKQLTDTTDKDLNYSLGFCVSTIECNLAIITASAPAMWAVLRRLMPSLSSAGKSSRYYKKSHSRTGGGAGDENPFGSGTVGGTAFALKDMRIRADGAEGRVKITSRGSFDRDSDEQRLYPGAIVQTSEYIVSHDADSRLNLSEAETNSAR